MKFRRHAGEATAGSSLPPRVRVSPSTFPIANVLALKMLSTGTHSRMEPPDQNFNLLVFSLASTPNTNNGTRLVRRRCRVLLDRASSVVRTAKGPGLMNRDVAVMSLEPAS